MKISYIKRRLDEFIRDRSYGNKSVSEVVDKFEFERDFQKVYWSLTQVSSQYDKATKLYKMPYLNSAREIWDLGYYSGVRAYIDFEEDNGRGKWNILKDILRNVKRLLSIQ